MSQPSDNPAPEGTKADTSVAVARIALIGTIVAALIGATASITVALVQHETVPTPLPAPSGSHSTGSAPSTSPDPAITRTPSPSPDAAIRRTPAPSPSPDAAITRPPATPDGVTYRCTGSAPAGIDITYGPSGSGLQATSLPFTAHDRAVSEAAQYYSITAQLNGGGHVTCTVTVTAAGRTITRSGSARGGYNEATPEICSGWSGGERHWVACG